MLCPLIGSAATEPNDNNHNKTNQLNEDIWKINAAFYPNWTD